MCFSKASRTVANFSQNLQAFQLITFTKRLYNVKVLPALEGVKATIKLKPDAKPVFCRARKVPLAMEDQVKIELTKLQGQGIIASVDPGGVMNASTVVWQR